MGYAPTDAAFVADPHPVFARLREEAPVAWSAATDQWVLSRHADVSALLRDRRLGRSYLHVATHAEMGRPDDPAHLAPFWRVVRAGMLDVEPPDHTRLRRLVSKAFTPRMVEGLRPRVAEIAAGLVRDLRDAGSDGSPVDLVAAVAEPLPVEVISELLGVPASDRHLLRPWSADICAMYELAPSRETGERAVRACEEFGAYLLDLADQRRRAPGADLLSALVQVADDGERLTPDELVGTCVLLLNAGHEATVGTTANGWWSLLRHPGELARLRSGEVDVATAVEELLRFETPLPMFERYVLEDLEVHGTLLPRGTEVALLLGSANRDGAVFPEPDRFDVGRGSTAHLTFGAGIHFCLGAPLARLELTTSFETVLREVPDLALAAEPAWAGGFVIRTLRDLLVTV
ncbi:cytochrome P450 [Pseudokineococcus marinus]|uniref:Cytochrome P450 n=1 Tax=Pseudokineococcus marinus TaxID=351215 RepID=A0A849BNZ9_9ACTN|nr:cytochrome P450 [Pseudokineococcus marinus]